MLIARSGGLESALTDFAEAIRLQPENALFWYYQGDTFYDAKQFDEAIASLTNSIRLDSKDADVFSLRGRAYRAEQEYASARRLRGSDSLTTGAC